MDTMLLDDWIEMYERAWRSEDTGLLSDIFTEDVSYRLSPLKQPMQGLAAVIAFWKEKQAKPGEQFDMSHEIVAIEGDTAVVRVDVHYMDQDEHWKDLWILNFTSEGRCRTFEEWPIKQE